MLTVLAAHVVGVVHVHLRAIQADVIGDALYEVIKIPLFLSLFPLLGEAKVHAGGIVVFAENVVGDIKHADGLLELCRSEHTHGVVVLRADGVLAALTARDGDDVAADALSQRKRRQPV